MSADNVTPIRPKAGPQPGGPRKPRRPRLPAGITLRDPPEGPSSLHVFQALHGVCQACESTASDERVDALALATAARILADMLEERMQ